VHSAARFAHASLARVFLYSVTMDSQLGHPKSAGAWKEHPVAVVAAVAGSVATFVIVVFTTVVIPTMTASLQNEVTSLRRQLSDEGGDMGALRKKIENLEAELKTTKSQLAEIQLGNDFLISRSPYPTGLSKIRIGDPLDDIAKTFPENSIEHKRDWWSVKGQHAIFTELIYYFDRSAKDKRVTQMLFFFDSKVVPTAAMRGKVIEALGRPVSEGPKPDCYIWRIDQKLFLLVEERHYLIRATQPGCDPD
jgi:hypothetical protein